MTDGYWVGQGKRMIVEMQFDRCVYCGGQHKPVNQRCDGCGAWVYTNQLKPVPRAEPQDRRPYSIVCHGCNGKGGACAGCNGTGFVPETRENKLWKFPKP